MERVRKTGRGSSATELNNPHLSIDAESSGWWKSLSFPNLHIQEGKKSLYELALWTVSILDLVLNTHELLILSPTVTTITFLFVWVHVLWYCLYKNLLSHSGGMRADMHKRTMEPLYTLCRFYTLPNISRTSKFSWGSLSYTGSW